MADENGNNGINIKTPLGTIRASGFLATMILMHLFMFVLVLWLQTSLQSQHVLISENLNDLFIANVLTEEQKKNLPMLLQERLERRLAERAQKAAERK